MRVSYDNLQQGIFPDLPPWDLPPGAFSDSRNVRYQDGAAEKVKGYAQTFTTDLSSSAAAIWCHPISDGTNIFWAYADQGQVFATDGTTHANISSVSYAAGLDLAWNGGYYNKYLVLNNGVDAPQTWDPSLSNKAQALTNWPASTLAHVVRPFKRFLVALRVTETGTYDGTLLRWSSSATPGSLPSSWDFSDPANDSGRTQLAQSGDALVDCLPMRDTNVVYKQNHVWLMDYVGGSSVFSFRQAFSQAGLLSEDCARAFKGMHFCFGTGDIYIHDGNQATSLLTRRAKKWLYNRIDSTHYRKCFVLADYANQEMWACFPETGQTWPNLALCWNWEDNSIYPRELGNPMTFAMHGFTPSSASTTYDGATSTFDAAGAAFNEATYNPTDYSAILLDGAQTKAYQTDAAEDYDGTAMTAYLERQSITLMRDHERYKRIYRVYPRVLGTTSDTLNVYVGVRSAIGATVTYSGPYTYTIGVDTHIDVLLTGRVVDVKFEYTGSNPIRLFGYDVDFEPDGYR